MNISTIQSGNPLSMMSSVIQRDCQANSTTLDPNSPSTLSIYDAIRGTKILVSSYQFTSMNLLKSYISSSLNIKVHDLFLLTPFGIKLKFSMLVHEEVNRIFVYDRRFFNPALLDRDLSSQLILTFKDELTANNVINLIKPMKSPLMDARIPVIARELTSKIRSGNSESAKISSTKLNMANLRLFLSSLKRNVGWASALVSDFGSIPFDEDYTERNKEVQNIMESLNVLIQYINLTFKDMEKSFNHLIDSFISLHSNTMQDSWKVEYDKLNKVSFGTVRLGDLIDENKLTKNAQQSKILVEEINVLLKNTRAAIETKIIQPKKDLVKEYEYMQLKYAKDVNDKPSDHAESYNEKLDQLKITASHIMDAGKNFPTFEELISTTSHNSPELSPVASKRIRTLIQIYQKQISNEIPTMSSLADSLYNVQLNRYSLVKKLQRRLLDNTLAMLINLQISLFQVNKTLTESIGEKVDQFRECELQLSSVTDIPLIFGMWIIANLSNKKHKKCLTKLAHKSGEVLDKLIFAEIKSRESWFTKFSEDVGVDECNKIGIDESSKKWFLNGNLVAFKVTAETKPPRGQIKSRRRFSTGSNGSNGYLSTLNQILQKINGRPSRVKESEQVSDEQEGSSFSDKVLSQIEFQQVFNYIQQLDSVGVKSEIVNQLWKFVDDVGLDRKGVQGKEGVDKDVVVGTESFDYLGSFDARDKVYLKFLKKFLRNFEIEGITVDVRKYEGKPSEKGKEQELIAGYENRIRKLENLLHERAFKQFNEQWAHEPVSVQFSESGNLSDGQAVEFNIQHVASPPPSTNEAKLQSLQAENKKLREQLNELTGQSDVSVLEQLKQKNRELQLELEMNQKELDIRDKQLGKAEFDLKVVVADKMTVLNERQQADNKIKDLQKGMDDLKSMNDDLVENLSQKEKEFNRESRVNQQELNELRLKVEELEENGGLENEFSSQVVNAIAVLEKDADLLTKRIYDDLTTFCLMLEAIGLLIVRKGNDDPFEINIKRVKGLRAKKRKLLTMGQKPCMGEDKSDPMEATIFEVVSTDILSESEKSIHWLPERSDEDEKLDSETINSSDEAVKPVSTLKKFVEAFNSNNAQQKFENFKGYSFLDNRLVIEKAFRRFNDVETLARRLQKEKGQQKVEIDTLQVQISQRLAIRDFKVGDLVLFLKTMNTMIGDKDKVKSGASQKQPWAIFNIGSPNHYLNNIINDGGLDIESRDWFIGRIEKLQTRKVTDGNYDNTKENPFKLSVGFTWHLVDASLALEFE